MLFLEKPQQALATSAFLDLVIKRECGRDDGQEFDHIQHNNCDYSNATAVVRVIRTVALTAASEPHVIFATWYRHVLGGSRGFAAR